MAGAPPNPAQYVASLQQLLTNGANGGPLVDDLLHNFGVDLRFNDRSKTHPALGKHFFLSWNYFSAMFFGHAHQSPRNNGVL